MIELASKAYTWIVAHPWECFRYYVGFSAFVSAIKPKTPAQFDRMARLITPRGARFVVALAAWLMDFLKFAKEMLGVLVNEHWSESAERALKSMPPPSNETPPILIEGEEKKK